MFSSTHTQQRVMPKIDLTKLKSMTEEDWNKLVNTIPFTPNMSKPYRDYRDNSNLGRTNFIFKENTLSTAKESGLTMLRTLNFLC